MTGVGRKGGRGKKQGREGDELNNIEGHKFAKNGIKSDIWTGVRVEV